MNVVLKHFESLFRLLYPLQCQLCGIEVFSTQIPVCWRCIEKLPYTGFEQHEENPVKKIFYGRLAITHAYSLLFFHANSLSQMAIHQIKYRGKTDLANWLGELMGEKMIAVPHYRNIDFLIPLPLHPKKLALRGYNQAALLAEGISAATQIPVKHAAVIRNVNTSSQTRKSRIDRWQNVANVFDLKTDHELEGKHVLLIDDVVTTGATMEAMGRVLLKVPNLRLSLASLAYASRI